MRLDLYLKMSKIVKRRAIAQALCNAGRVLVNGQTAKPSKGLKPKDVVEIRLPSRNLELEVMDMPQKGMKQAIERLYRVKSESRAEEK